MVGSPLIMLGRIFLKEKNHMTIEYLELIYLATLSEAEFASQGLVDLTRQMIGDRLLVLEGEGL